MTKLTKKHKRGIKRKVDLEVGIVPPKSAVFKNRRSITVKINIKMKKILFNPDLIIIGLTVLLITLILTA